MQEENQLDETLNSQKKTSTFAAWHFYFLESSQVLHICSME